LIEFARFIAAKYAKLPVVLKPHTQENLEQIEAAIDALGARPANLTVTAVDANTIELIEESEYVIGVYSTAMFEAVALGCKVGVLKLAGLKGFFQNAVTEQVSYVNAPLLAEQRGVAVKLTVDSLSEEYRNVTSIKATLADGTTASVSGTVIGPKLHQKIVAINGYEVELAMAENMVLMVYGDRPGIVAIYGKAFAEAGINIAAMQIARQQKGGKALSVITVDSPVEAAVLEQVRVAIEAEQMTAINVNFS
jgi:iron-sulfur-dependent L-serine dehydratase beta subunit